MLPAPARILVCPSCGEHVEILSLRSGNTFGGKQWSDTKSVYPMLPQVSMVQKCPKCGKYFFTYHCEKVPNTDGDYGWQKGISSYEDWKAAYNQLLPEIEDTLNPSEKIGFYFSLIIAFNDCYNRDVAKETASEEEWAFFKSIVKKTLAYKAEFQPDALIDAELHREIGEFDACIELLKTYAPDNDFVKKIAADIKAHAEAKDTRAFLLEA